MSSGNCSLFIAFSSGNRLNSELCDTVIVIETKTKSGSHITEDIALEQERDDFAVPRWVGERLSKSCNGLISQEAGIVTDIKTLLEDPKLE